MTEQQAIIWAAFSYSQVFMATDGYSRKIAGILAWRWRDKVDMELTEMALESARAAVAMSETDYEVQQIARDS